MADQTSRHPMAARRPVYSLAGLDAVSVRRDLVYRHVDGARLALDVYAARGPAEAPAVVLVVGYSDAGARRTLGCTFREMGAFSGWGRLLAADGVAAITYETSTDPPADLQAALAYVRAHASELGVDAARIGLWACSGHAPTALGALLADGGAALACAALLYPYTLDEDGTRAVGEAAGTFRFANPTAGRTVRDLPANVPLFTARAGRDEMPGLNQALDRFIAGAVRANLPLTSVNHPTGPHAFDLLDDSVTSRATIAQVLAFLHAHLTP
jgi:hypothetical protein